MKLSVGLKVLEWIRGAGERNKKTCVIYDYKNGKKFKMARNYAKPGFYTLPIFRREKY